jgi:hypothetical protein
MGTHVEWRTDRGGGDRGLVFVLVGGRRQAKQESQINTDYTD